MVQLRGVNEESGKLIGFSGVADQRLEMLFIHPDYFGQGIGKKLLENSITEFAVTQVDVNEDNPQALGFYEKQGFKVVGRSEKDPSGKPYPILHMELFR